jgi:protein-S-isoprenylcysteine O-methyltransferase Ste14
MGRARAAVGSLVFFLVAPCIVAGVVPWWLTQWQSGASSAAWLPVRVVGLGLLVVAVLALVTAFARFVVEGHGTPAPVAPTDKLVVGGSYRYVRNPMYVAVVSCIVGQSLLLVRPVLLGYAVVVFVTVATFVRVYEEPTLHAQFGSGYDEYRGAVPGWIPRLRPWTAAGDEETGEGRKGASRD